MTSRYRILATIQADGCNNLEDEDARKKLLLPNVQHRVKRSDWRSKATPAMETLGLLHVSTTNYVPSQTTLEPTTPNRCMLHDGKEITRAPEDYSPQGDQKPGSGGPPTLHRWLDP